MRRTALALACSLLLPLPALASDAVMKQWRAYAQQAVTPDFSWARSAPVKPPTVLDAQRAATIRSTVAGTVVAMTPLGQLQLSQSSGHFGFTWRDEDTRLRDSLSPLSAQYAATTLVAPLGSQARVNLTAVIARQRFMTPGFGSTPWQGEPQWIGVAGTPGVVESAHGSGVRFGVERALGAQFEWSLAMQSRLEMDAFKTYRGVYSEPGDFDVPGFVQTGLRWMPGARTEVGFDVQRVFFSDVTAFTSPALPTRLLALLGDVNAPEFAWRDLTVYSLEAAREVGSTGGRWSLRYSTQQQPRPTSTLLDRALAPNYSNRNFAVGFQQPLGALGRLQFAASYSPSSYFLAASPYVHNALGERPQVEFEAHWTLPF